MCLHLHLLLLVVPLSMVRRSSCLLFSLDSHMQYDVCNFWYRRNQHLIRQIYQHNLHIGRHASLFIVLSTINVSIQYKIQLPSLNRNLLLLFSRGCIFSFEDVIRDQFLDVHIYNLYL